MKFRLAGLNASSLVNGPGNRMVVFAQGCRHNCKGCFNPTTHDFNGGIVFSVRDVFKQIKNDWSLNGVTFSGGDPVEQYEAFGELAKLIKTNTKLNVWCYTGYLYDDLVGDMKYRTLLENIDVLVDGKFELEKREEGLLWKGSSNQRVIDVQKSLKEKKIIYYNSEEK